MKFEIKCKECDSTDCIIEEMIDYDWEENPISDGYIIYCIDVLRGVSCDV